MEFYFMSLENKKQLLNKLKIAMASGHSRVQHGDKSIQYRSLDEMRQIANDLEDEIAALDGKPRRKRVLVATRRGW